MASQAEAVEQKHEGRDITVLSTIRTREDGLSELSLHIAIPSRFEAHTVLDVIEHAEGFELHERHLEQPFRKDYDSVENPMEWRLRFDVSNWSLITAFDGNIRIGGAICAFDTPGVDMLEGRNDLAVLWDLRVAPEARQRGIGSALFCAVEAWARTKNCRELKIETQNTNVPACRFYEKQGCRLRCAYVDAYPGLPHEVQLIWRKTLAG
jgi:ribosomal protein S18 acetylase RimI-like enzyme